MYEAKSGVISISLCWQERGGGGGFHLHTHKCHSDKIRHSACETEHLKMRHSRSGLKVVHAFTNSNFQKPTSNFLSPVLSWNLHLGGVGGWQRPILKSQLQIFSMSSPEVKFTFSGGGGLVMTNFQLLMLSPNLLKSKKIVFYKGFAENFWPKKCLGMVLGFEYQVFRVYANHKKKRKKKVPFRYFSPA